MKRRVSTASFSTAACWLGVRIFVRGLDGGVDGGGERLFVYKRGGFFDEPERCGLRDWMLAGGARDGPPVDLWSGRGAVPLECSRQKDSYVEACVNGAGFAKPPTDRSG